MRRPATFRRASSGSAAATLSLSIVKRARPSTTCRSCASGMPRRIDAVASKEISVRVRWRSSASVPVSTTLPARMMLTRSHSSSTSERMWLDSSTVAPASFMRAISRRKTTSISGSSPLVGSSKMYRSAGTESAAMSATFCRLPLEYARPLVRGSNWNASMSRCFSSRYAGVPAAAPRSRASTSIDSPPDRFGQMLTSPGTYAMRRCRGTAARHGSCPKTDTSPEVARASPSRMRMVVDLPAPFGPRKPCTWPDSTARSRPSRART